MKRIFISMPMNGFTRKENISSLKIYQKRIERKLGEKIKLTNRVCAERQLRKHGALWCLGKSIQQLSKADVVCFVDGWEYARGCKIEHKVAKEYHKDILK